MLPTPGRLVISGNSMAVTLSHADERRGYTLVDDATFRQLGPSLDLVLPRRWRFSLLNTYAVVYPADHLQARQFAEWLTQGQGRTEIRAYRIAGFTAFTPWPQGCADTRPQDLPC